MEFGPTIRAAAGPTDVITVANADTNFLLQLLQRHSFQ